MDSLSNGTIDLISIFPKTKLVSRSKRDFFLVKTKLKLSWNKKFFSKKINFFKRLKSKVNKANLISYSKEIKEPFNIWFTSRDYRKISISYNSSFKSIERENSPFFLSPNSLNGESHHVKPPPVDFSKS